MHALIGVATLIRLDLESSPLAQGAAQGLWQSRHQARHLAVLSGSLKKDAVLDPAEGRGVFDVFDEVLEERGCSFERRPTDDASLFAPIDVEASDGRPRRR